MAQVDYSISFAGAAQLQVNQAITAQVLPLLNQAVRAVASHTAQHWQARVQQAKLWSGEKDAYRQSITWSMTGDFTARVQSDYKQAAEIETGRAPRDLKRMLDTSLKVRRTQSGKRFLVIPFRHNTPGKTAHAQAMPKAAYDLAKAMTPSRVLSVGQRPAGQVVHLSPKTGMHPSGQASPFLSNHTTKAAAMVAARQYAWGSRLTRTALREAGLTPAQAKQYAGMVKMDTTTPGSKKKSSAYMTFRTMMEGAKGWIVPAQPGQYLLRQTVTEMQPKAQAAFQEAIKRTMGGA